MGLFSEYLALGDKLQPQLDDLRHAQLARIGMLRNSAVIVYAARIGQTPVNVNTGVSFDDIAPFHDVLSGISGDRVTVILETLGGIGEVGKNMVEMLHDKFKHVSFVVPGTAKSTGTIMCLGGHEIMMGPASSLGPIDAQIQQNGKQFSADALVEMIKEIQAQIARTGALDPVYIPMLQNISPGELQSAQNALDFAKNTVAQWLCRYKFYDWQKSDEDKLVRAKEIASALASQARWHTHGHSIRISDLRLLELKIVDYSENAELNDAILRYYVLLRLTFDSGPLYKIFETPTETIGQRFSVPAISPDSAAQALGQLRHASSAQIGMQCAKCKTQNTFQLDFVPGEPLQPGSRRFPDSGIAPCVSCNTALNVSGYRTEIEKKIGRPALAPQPSN